MSENLPLRARLGESSGKRPARTKEHSTVGLSAVSPGALSSLPGTSEQAPTPPVSLWDTAYNNLKIEQPKLLTAYENLLSYVPHRSNDRTKTLSPSEEEDFDKVENYIPQDNLVSRQEKFKRIIELNLKHAEENSTRLKDGAAQVSKVIVYFQNSARDLFKDVPYASAVIAGISLVLPLLTNPTIVEAANRDGFTYVTSQMRYYVQMESLLLPEHMKPGVKADLAERLTDLYQRIIQFQVLSILRLYRGTTKKYAKDVVNYDGWDERLEQIKVYESDLHRLLSEATSSSSLDKLKILATEAEVSRKSLSKIFAEIQKLVDVAQDRNERSQRREDKRCLRALQSDNPDKSKKRIEGMNGGLLRNSYCWITQNDEFRQWRDGNDSQLLWIQGDPGKGKTMLLCGIINELSKPTSEAGSISYFFCQAASDGNNNASAVLRGLIRMLVQKQPSLLEHLHDREFEGLNGWIELCEAFESILGDAQLQRTYLVIDALDECILGRELLLKFVARNSTAYKLVKWVVSSRNWPSIETPLATSSTIKLCLERKAADVSAAVSFLIDDKVNRLARQYKYDSTLRDAVYDYLSSNADGTFLWVALVCKELEKTRTWEVEKILKDIPPGLSALYERMMQQVRDSRYAGICEAILATISLVRRPIKLDELTSLVELPVQSHGNPEALSEILSFCGSFLSLRNSTITFVHQSAKDYVFDNAGKGGICHGISDVHYSIFERSLNVISTKLRHDIYRLGDPGHSIKQIKTPHPDPLAEAGYACVYWVDHLHSYNLHAHDKNVKKVDSLLTTFFRHHYLFWLEALSLLRKLPQGETSMLRLKELLVKDTKSPKKLIDCVEDACQFMRYHRRSIENWPLQIYYSALIFSPSRSITRIRYKAHVPKWIVEEPVIENDWNACRQTIEGHSSRANSLAWSQDATRLISPSYNNTVKIWDMTTTKHLETLEGRRDAFWSVTWLHDVTQLASTSHDKTVKIWNLATGNHSKLKGHKERIKLVAWSQDAKQLASASHDKTVKIWNLATGNHSTLKGHSSCVRLVAWSQDGMLLASVSTDNIVKIWETATAKLKSTLNSCGNICSVAWSGNSKLLSASYHITVKVWNLDSEKCDSTIRGNSRCVKLVAWSQDATRLASASYDNNVKIWDPVTGECIHTLKGHRNEVCSLSWSKDASRIASASYDDTVKIWNPTRGTCIETLEGHSNEVRSVAISKDATQIAAAYSENTVKIWNPATSTCGLTLKGHSDKVWSLAWSHDGTRLASASHDKTVKIWNPATGICISTLKGHRQHVRLVAWSPDATQLASVSDGAGVRIWDTPMDTPMDTILCKCTKTLRGRRGPVYSVAWSKDATRLALALNDRTVTIWDLTSGTSHSTLEVACPLQSMEFDDIDASYLYTDLGILDIERLLRLEKSKKESSRSMAIGYGLDGSGVWITSGGKRVIWLPPEYRPSASHVGKGVIVLGCFSGKVVLMRFSDRS